MTLEELQKLEKGTLVYVANPCGVDTYVFDHAWHTGSRWVVDCGAENNLDRHDLFRTEEEARCVTLELCRYRLDYLHSVISSTEKEIERLESILCHT